MQKDENTFSELCTVGRFLFQKKTELGLETIQISVEDIRSRYTEKNDDKKEKGGYKLIKLLVSGTVPFSQEKAYKEFKELVDKEKIKETEGYWEDKSKLKAEDEWEDLEESNKKVEIDVVAEGATITYEESQELLEKLDKLEEKNKTLFFNV